MGLSLSQIFESNATFVAGDQPISGYVVLDTELPCFQIRFVFPIVTASLAGELLLLKNKINKRLSG